MDIEKYSVNKNMYEVRDSIKSKYEVLKNLSNQIGKYTKPIVERKVNEFIDSFKEFFTEHGFKISSNHSGAFEATNEKAKFEFEMIEKDNYEAKFLFSMRSEQKYVEVFVKATKESDKLISWKSNPGLTSFVFYNFEIQSDTTAEKLEKIEMAIDENIEWFNKTLTDLDKLEFVFSSEIGRVYKDFRDFFEKI